MKNTEKVYQKYSIRFIQDRTLHAKEIIRENKFGLFKKYLKTSIQKYCKS